MRAAKTQTTPLSATVAHCTTVVGAMHPGIIAWTATAFMDACNV
jgi:hypothetical protein